MIEAIDIDGVEVPISLNATGLAIPGGHTGWWFTTRQLSQHGQKYFTRAAGFLFIDNEPAVSLAAQLVRWTETGLEPGEYHVHVPGDNVVYRADIIVNPDYVLVNQESINSFEQTIEHIRAHAPQSLVHQSGKLATTLTQQDIENKDLLFNLNANKKNAFYLRRGYTLQDIAILSLFPILLISLLPMSLKFWQERRQPEPISIAEPVVLPTSSIQVSEDLPALSKLLNRYMVLLAYEIESLEAKSGDAQYAILANGRYQPNQSITRLNEVANRLDGSLTLADNAWRINARASRTENTVELPLAPASDVLEAYRITALAFGLVFNVKSRQQLADHSQTELTLTMASPSPHQLQALGKHLSARGHQGKLKSAQLTTSPMAGWDSVILTIVVLSQ